MTLMKATVYRHGAHTFLGRAARRSWRKVAIAAVVLVVGSCGGGDGTTPQGRPGTTLTGDLELGEAVFRKNCASCHGRTGSGGMGPKLADGAVVDRYPDPSEHRDVVVDGRGAMPAWGDRLSDDEIDAVVRYEREGL